MAHEKPKKRPSMADVGRVAKVSAQTVSRYYTGGYVSEATREVIEAAVAELGYQHNKLPSILRAEHSGTIGYLSMGPLNYGNSGLLVGTSRAARREGQALITTQLDLDPDDPEAYAEARKTLDNFLSMRVDGIIVGTPYFGMEDLITTVGRTVPVVSLSEVRVPGVDTVHADSYGAARRAMEHLVALGHTRILHVAGPGNRNESSQRVQGYLDVLAEAGLQPLPLEHCAEWDAASGAEAGARVDPSSFTAVFSANDEIALGFLGAMRARGLSAPDDYSIVGVDDMPEAAHFQPPLTSSKLDFEHLGETAIAVLLGRIYSDREIPRVETIPSELSVRSSTAGAPAVAAVPQA